MRILIVYLAVGLFAATAHADVVSISEVKEIDSKGMPKMLGEIVTVSGVVTVPSGIFSQELADLDAYIQDKTGGINLYTRNLPGIRLRLGDSVVVTGQINVGGAKPNAGNTRLKILNIDELSAVGRGTVPVPVNLTAGILGQPAQPPLEPYEGVLVRLEDVTIESGTWPSEPGIDSDMMGQDTSGSFKFLIDGDTDIGGTQVPEEPFILIGVVVQHSGYPYLTGYRVWPRSRYDDFLAMGNGSGKASIEPSKVDNDVTSFDLRLTLAGNLRDTITAFSVDLPLDDGWIWPGGTGNVEMAGPGLSGATVDIAEVGVGVSGAEIYDDDLSYGVVTLKGMTPPAGLAASTVIVRTSVDGVIFEEITLQPMLESAYPKPDVVINEIYTHDGSTSLSNAFIELHNSGSSTAFLEGFALCEQRVVPYCDIEVAHVFGENDTVPAGGFLVIAETTSGFTARFGTAPDLKVSISPLGRSGGDGAICNEDEVYETISLWRDATLTDLIDYMEYRDALVCWEDLCDEFGSSDDAFPYIPPAGYSLLAGEFDPCCPYQVLSGLPTPGAENVVDYLVPTVRQRISHTTSTLELILSEPMDVALLRDTRNYEIGGANPAAAVASVSGEKVMLLFDDLVPGAASIRVGGLKSMPGVTMRDSSYKLTVSSSPCTTMCRLQAYDENGFSPLADATICVLGFITVPPGVFQPDYSSIYVQGLDGCGVNVFSYDVPSPTPKLGDFVSVTGEVEEYVSSGGAGSTTELYMSSANSLTILSKGYPEPDALVLSTAAISREDHEGKLIESEGAIISTSSYDFYMDDGSGGIQVYQNYTPIDFSQYHAGMYVRVKGVVLQYDYARPYLEGYELVPRYQTDIEIVEDAFPRRAQLEVDARVFCPSCGDEGFDITIGGEPQSALTLRLFDGNGREVTTLYGGLSVGTTIVTWDGKDDEGKPVPPGLYICHLEVVNAITGTTSRESVPIVVGMELK